MGFAGDPRNCVRLLEVGDLTPGNPDFGLACSGMLPSSSYFQLLGTNPTAQALDVSAALGGVQPGLTLWVANILFAELQPTTDAAGEGSTQLALPNSPALLGG